jgi:hypothetical protein
VEVIAKGNADAHSVIAAALGTNGRDAV